MRLFADSSALAERCLREPGRDVVLARCAAADEVIISFLAPIEVVSAFNRLRRAGLLTDEECGGVKQKLVADAHNATVVLSAPSIETGAFRCLERAALRASDAAHVASALECRPDLNERGMARFCFLTPHSLERLRGEPDELLGTVAQVEAFFLGHDDDVAFLHGESACQAISRLTLRG